MQKPVSLFFSSCEGAVDRSRRESRVRPCHRKALAMAVLQNLLNKNKLRVTARCYRHARSTNPRAAPDRRTVSQSGALFHFPYTDTLWMVLPCASVPLPVMVKVLPSAETTPVFLTVGLPPLRY